MATAMRYQIAQERYEAGFDNPTRDTFPMLFGTVDEARERAKMGTASMFEQEGDSIYIEELQYFKDGNEYAVIATGRTFELEAK